MTTTTAAKLTATERALLEGIHNEMTGYGLTGAVITGADDLRTARRRSWSRTCASSTDRTSQDS